jgi:glycosyltransferase involved in cell wall biosynthesis
MEPLVSVIIPTYNRGNLVVQAVQSVFEQTYKKIEIIVVDDGSTDNTRDVLREYEGKIDYVYQERSERSKARNEGFRRSKGDYIAFLDSDDLWRSMKIEKQVQVLDEKPDVGLVYAGVQFVDMDGNPYPGKICWDALERKRRSLYEDLMTTNIIGAPSTVMVRRLCLNTVGLFDESMVTCEDLDLWRRLAQRYVFHKIDLPLVRFRIHFGNTQGKLSMMAKGYETIIRKVSEDTPSEFHHYKNEAIIKLLSKVAALYRNDGKLFSFFIFCGKSMFCKPNWMIKYSFWRDFLRLSAKKLMQSNE